MSTHAKTSADVRGAAGSSPSPTDFIDVLVVDPNADVRELYKQALARIGAHVHEAADGREAMVQVYAIRPHVVVLDARLPYIDGIQLCSVLRQDAASASIRIVGITGDSSPDHVHRFREFGADVVFVKPVPVEELVTAVQPEAMKAQGIPVGIFDVPPVASRPIAKARLHERYMSTTPPDHPPHLRCPQCDAVLEYQHSHIGGVSDRHPEQWDYFVCQRHGTFQYRHRTRRLRRAS